MAGTHREKMTRLAERLTAAGVRVVGWRWVEQGGPFVTINRPRQGVEGEQAEPVVSGTDIEGLLPPEE